MRHNTTGAITATLMAAALVACSNNTPPAAVDTTTTTLADPTQPAVTAESSVPLPEFITSAMVEEQGILTCGSLELQTLEERGYTEDELRAANRAITLREPPPARPVSYAGKGTQDGYIHLALVDPVLSNVLRMFDTYNFPGALDMYCWETTPDTSSNWGDN